MTSGFLFSEVLKEIHPTVPKTSLQSRPVYSKIKIKTPTLPTEISKHIMELLHSSGLPS
jgi:hypothetical protein